MQRKCFSGSSKLHPLEHLMQANIQWMYEPRGGKQPVFPDKD